MKRRAGRPPGRTRRPPAADCVHWNRPQRLLTSLLALAATAVLASWGLSFSWPHALPLPRDYGVRFERGTIQLRRQGWTRVAIDTAGRTTIVPAPPGSVAPGPERGGPNGAVLLFSPWRP